MWNPKFAAALPEVAADEDSWEVRAFAEDTSNALGTTWPPRSYTCTFCRREFRSAQALGGHMNVHRRDRARLHQAPGSTSSVSPSTSTLLIPTQEIVSNGGLCLLYSIPNPNGIFCPTTTNGCMQTPTTLLSTSPFSSTNYNLTSSTHPSIDFPVAPHKHNSSGSHSNNTTEPSPCSSNDNNHESAIEELDLELRLGRGSSPS
ncbi:hypothetical protein LguiA_015317 [Lonicera macranthoides]